MINVTDEALEQISTELNKMKIDLDNPYIRLQMIVGWGGARLQLALEESANESDIVVEEGGRTFLIANHQKRYFENVTIDYRKGSFGMGEYFVRFN